MILVITGPQASGKGTQADLLAERLGLVHLSTGVELRKLSQENSPLGRKVAEYVNQKGALVPDGILTKVVKNFLNRNNLKKGIIIDGTPRIEKQLYVLEGLLNNKGAKIDRALYLYISQKEVLKRLGGRLVCPKCARNYHLTTNPPKKKNICDFCAVKLAKREDENPKAIKNRLAIYQKKTKPILKIYQKRGILEKIDGERPIEVIYEDVVERLKKAGLIR